MQYVVHNDGTADVRLTYTEIRRLEHLMRSRCTSPGGELTRDDVFVWQGLRDLLNRLNVAPISHSTGETPTPLE